MQNALIKFGNFIFRWRDTIFTLIFLPAFYLVTMPEMTAGGENTDSLTFFVGFTIALLGMTIRGITVASGFVKRSGVQKKIHAEGVVRAGFFAHTRNPLYVGNYLIVTGAILCLNLTLYYIVFLPMFYLIYYSITLAEENYLKSKFGKDYENYLKSVNRYLPGNFSRIKSSFSEIEFSFKRFLKREYGSTALLTSSLLMIYAVKFHFQYGLDYSSMTGIGIWCAVAFLILLYVIIRILTKLGKMELEAKGPVH
jgi:protein-S-isoprenylcysteine O-methyltransferase Ste14